MSFTLAVLTLALFLSPLGQSAVNSWLKNKFINDFDVELSVGALFINPVGITSFTDFLIRDHRNDTLIFVDYFEFESYHFGDLISNSIHLGDVTVDSLFLNLVKYKEEDQSNLDIFIKKVKPDNTKLRRLSASTIQLNESKVQFQDLNKADSTKLLFSNINTRLDDLNFNHNNFSTSIEETSFYARPHC